GNHARLDRLAIDLLADELREDERTLRMADQDIAAALVIVLEIIVPSVTHVVVMHPVVDGSAAGRAGEQRSQPRERYLPVHRRIQAALRSETRELLPNDVHLRRIRVHVAIW